MLLVRFTADWCGWCHKLADFLDQNKELFSAHFNIVAIATDKMANGEAVLEELKKDREGGMPWMVILNGDGKEIISSVGPEGNVGCPATTAEIEHFVNMIKTSSEASDETLQKIGENLAAFHKKK